MFCAIWYHLYNLKNLKSTYVRGLLLVKLQAKPATLVKVTLLLADVVTFTQKILNGKLHDKCRIFLCQNE